MKNLFDALVENYTVPAAIVSIIALVGFTIYEVVVIVA
jgi:hypothetical protein